MQGQQPPRAPPFGDVHVPTGPDSTIVFPAVALDSTPRFLACGQLGYPEGLRRAGITGRVLVDLAIGRDGTPEHNNVWVEESADSGFDEDALAFVRSCHFTPPTRAGARVRTRLYLPVDFKLESGPPRAKAPSATTLCAGRAGADSAVYDTTEVNELPPPRGVPERAYPSIAEQLRVEGRVVVAMIIGADGTVDRDSIRVVRGVDPYLDSAALGTGGDVLAGLSRWSARARVGPPLFLTIGLRAISGYAAGLHGGRVSTHHLDALDPRVRAESEFVACGTSCGW